MPSVINTRTPDALLAEYGVGYSNAAYVATRVMPVASVRKQSDYYPIWGKEAFRLREDAADAHSDINTVDYEVSRDTYFAGGHALAAFIGDDESVDPVFDRRRDSATLLMESLLLAMESRAYSFLCDAANYTGGDVLTTAANLDSASVDVAAWMDTQKDAVAAKCGRRPNAWTIGQDVWKGLKHNSGLRTAILGTSGGVLSVDMVRQHLELDDLAVTRTLYDTAPEGQEPVLSPLWTAEHGVLYWRGPASSDQFGRPALGEKVPTFARTFVWSPGAGDTNPEAAGNVGGVRVLRWRHQGAPKGTGGGEWLQVSYYYGFEVTCAAAAQLQTNLLGAT